MRLTHTFGSASRLRRGIGAAAAAVALLGAAACDTAESILDVSDPDIVNPDDIRTAAGANALRLGTLARFSTATSGDESMWLLGGLLADEWRSSDTFTERNETDRRALTVTNAEVTGAFRDMHRARLSAEQAIEALREFEADGWQIGQMYVIEAYIETLVAEHFCDELPFSTVVSGRLESGPSLSGAETYERAIAHADSAITAATGPDAGNAAQAAAIVNAAKIVKARALLNLKRYADAAAAVAGVPTSYAWEVEHSDNTDLNAVWQLNNSIGRYFLGNGEGEVGIDFVNAGDPRVPSCSLSTIGTCDEDTPVEEPFDPSTPDQNLRIQQVWPTRYSTSAPISGIEARLIEAEAALAAGNAGGARTILNTLRATAGLPALGAATVDVVFRERAFWLFGTGHRLGDLRRLVRQYERTESSVYPNGDWWKGGEYGDDVNFPVPQAEENNLNFSRAACVTTEA